LIACCQFGIGYHSGCRFLKVLGKGFGFVWCVEYNVFEPTAHGIEADVQLFGDTHFNYAALVHLNGALDFRCFGLTLFSLCLA
jgi:hypothetical protein